MVEWLISILSSLAQIVAVSGFVILLWKHPKVFLETLKYMGGQYHEMNQQYKTHSLEIQSLHTKQPYYGKEMTEPAPVAYNEEFQGKIERYIGETQGEILRQLDIVA